MHRRRIHPVADMDKNNNVARQMDSIQRLSYIPLSSLYAVAAGTLFLWGFWSAFEINILQYIAGHRLSASPAMCKRPRRSERARAQPDAR